MRIEAFKPADMMELPERDTAEVRAVLAVHPEYLKWAAAHPSWTARIQGEVVAVAGVFPVWPGRKQLWSVISSEIGAGGMFVLTKAVKRGLLMLGPGRIEAHVREGFAPGIRWMNLLGFACETPEPMRKFLPDGAGAYMFARAL